MITQSPLSYVGVLPESSPNIYEIDRVPTTRDYNYNLGDIWIVKNQQVIYMLGSLRKDSMTGASQATWVKIYPGGSGGASSFPTNAGIATIIGGLLNIFGDLINVETSGTGNAITIDLFDNVTIQGTFTMSALSAGVVQQQAIGGFTSNNGTDGQLLIGSTALGPTWGDLTSTGSIKVTAGANTLNIELNAADTLTITADDMGTASPSMDSIDMPDQTNISLTGVDDTVTFNLNNSVVIGNDLTLTVDYIGDNNLTVTNNVTMNNLADGVVRVLPSGLLDSVNGTDGQVIIGGTTTPTFASITSSSITITPGPNTLDLTVSGSSPIFADSNSFLSYFTAPSGSQNTIIPNQVYMIGKTISGVDVIDDGSVFDLGGDGIASSWTAPEDGIYHFMLNTNLFWSAGNVQNSAPDYDKYQTWRFYTSGAFSVYNEQISINNKTIAFNSKQFFSYSHNPINVILELDMGDVLNFNLFTTLTITPPPGHPPPQSLFLTSFSNSNLNPPPTLINGRSGTFSGYQVA